MSLRVMAAGLLLSCTLGASGELKVTVTDSTGRYTASDYPEKFFDMPAPQVPASAEAKEAWRNQHFGLFIHWGIYSVLEGVWKGEQIPHLGEQIQRHAMIPGKEYVPVAAQFNPVKFDAHAYARLAKAAGMNYIIITAKHHDGFAMWDSKVTDFDIMDASPYRKDIIRMLADACREEGVQFGVYYSNPDWHHNGHSMEDTQFSVNEVLSADYMEFSKSQLRELLTNYGPLNEIFFDMGKPTLEQSADWARTVRECQPDCLVSGRVMNRQGDFYTMSDNSEPDTPIDTPWEVPCTFSAGPGHTWGYKNWVTRPPLEVEVKKRIRQLARVASRGGNYLLNIGPLPDGTILPYHVDALETMGAWVEKNQEAIFDTRPTPFEWMPWGEATWRDGKLYLQIVHWPKDGDVVVPNLLSMITRVYPLTNRSDAYVFDQQGDVLTIEVPATEPDLNLTILVAEFDGGLTTQVPIARPRTKDRITLDNTVKLKHSFYPGMTYRSIEKGTSITWDYEVKQPGRYDVSVTYKSIRLGKRNPLIEAPVVLALAGREYHVVLPIADDWTTVQLGSVDLSAADRATVTLTADLEHLQATSEPFHPGLTRVPVDVNTVELLRSPEYHQTFP